MGIFAAVVAAISMAASFAQAKKQGELADQQAANASEMARQQIAELTRQQQEVNDEAQSEKGERTRQADKEFASLVVSFAERGGLGTINALRGGQEVGFNEGQDLSRIEANRHGQVAGLQANKRVAQMNALGTIEEAKYIKSSAKLKALGSGLKIAGSAYGGSSRLAATKGTV